MLNKYNIIYDIYELYIFLNNNILEDSKVILNDSF